MQFVHPEVLWALSALTLPVLVHLFSFRRHRKVHFSQTAFLRELRQESRSRNRIRHWLVLLMRLLALTCLILAFAEPIREASGANGDTGAKTVSIYLDTSPSMQLEGSNGPLLEASKTGAIALVESHGPTDRFHVFTSGFDAEDRRLRSREEALERIAGIRPGHASPDIGDVLRNQQDVLGEDGIGRTGAYLFTDLQASSHRLDASTGALVDSALSVRFITQPVQPRVNVRVDSAWFDTPMRLTGRSEVLHVRIVHDAQRPVDDLPLSLDINGRRAAIGSFGLRPGLATDTVLRFSHEESGPVHAVIRTDDAPGTFDDDLHLGYTVAGAGDVDGDGLMDLLVGARFDSTGGTSAGAAWLIHGPADQGLKGAAHLWAGEAEEASYGLSSAGDVDGDGLDEVAVGAHLAGAGGVERGIIYIVGGVINDG